MELHDCAPPQVNDDGTGTIAPADETGKRDGVDGAESLAARRDGAVVQALEAMNVTWSRALDQLALASRMHERITELQADQVNALLSPVARRLIRLREQICDTAGQCTDVPIRSIGEQLGFFAAGIQDVLEMLGVEETVPTVGTPFDRSRLRAVERIPTPCAEQDRTVAETVCPGYSFIGSGFTLKPAEVRVYVYEPELGLTGSDRREMSVEDGGARAHGDPAGRSGVGLFTSNTPSDPGASQS